MRKKVSVVVLNWNGKNHLKKCLESLRKVSYPSMEVIVVDNNSTDGSTQMVSLEFPWVQLIENTENRGYSGGNNQGIKASKGDYIFILNNDTEVSKDFLTNLIKRMESNSKLGCVQPKILYGDNHAMLNAVGSYFTSTGFLYHYGYRKNVHNTKYNKPFYIFSAKGAAMLLRRNALKKVGLFDEDFFIFFEETDLCHRLWLAGYTVMYEPRSVIYHYEAVDTSLQMRNFTRTYLSLRNRVLSYIKNLEAFEILKMLPVLLILYFFSFFFYLLTFKFDQSLAVILSIVWNMVELPKTLKKRYAIQRDLRKVSDRKLFLIIKKDPHPAYYYYLFSYRIQDFPYEKNI